MLVHTAVGQQLRRQVRKQRPELGCRRKVQGARRQRHDDAVARQERVDRGVGKGGGGVNDDQVIVAAHVIDAKVEDVPELKTVFFGLTSGQGEFSPEEQRRGGHQIDTVPVSRPNRVADGRLGTHEQRKYRVLFFHFGIGQDSEQGRQRALGVGVNHQNFVPQQRHALSKRHSRRGLANAALEVSDAHRDSLAAGRPETVLSVLADPGPDLGQSELAPIAVRVERTLRQVPAAHPMRQ